MSKRKTRIFLPTILLLAVFITMFTTAYAFTIVHTYTIDNDDAQGYSNSRSGFDTLIQGSTLYYQDARKQVCDSDWHEYQYYFPEYRRYTFIYGEVSAYLYNVDFTDPAAQYTISSCNSYAYAIAGYLNQDLAAPGWNVVGTAENSLGGATTNGMLYITDSVRVASSQGNPTKYCGADAIKIELGY